MAGSLKKMNEKCGRVLALKRWAGLHLYTACRNKNLTSRLNSPYFEVTSRKLIKGSLTALSNKKVTSGAGFCQSENCIGNDWCR
jgi:beta-N-acetylhexosaminidase